MELKGLDFLYNEVRKYGWRTSCCYALSFGKLSVKEHEALFQSLKKKLIAMLQDPLHFLRIEITNNQHNYSNLSAEKIVDQQLIQDQDRNISSILNENINSARHFFMRNGNETILYFTFLHEIIDGFRALKYFQKYIIDQDRQTPFLLPSSAQSNTASWIKKTRWILKQWKLSYFARQGLPLNKKIAFEKNVSVVWNTNTVKSYAKKYGLSVGSVLMAKVIIAIQQSLTVKKKNLRMGTIALMPARKDYHNRFGYVHFKVPCDKDLHDTTVFLRQKMKKIYRDQAIASDAAFRSIHQYPSWLTHRILKTMTEKVDVVFSYLPVNRKAIKIGGHEVMQHQLFSADSCNPFFVYMMICGDKVSISAQVNTDSCNVDLFEERLKQFNEL